MTSKLNDIAILINSLSKEEFYDMVMEARGIKESNTTCQYCKSEMDNMEFVYRDSNKQKWALELILDEDMGENMLTVELDSSGSYEYIEFPINYCPYCGRRL